MIEQPGWVWADLDVFAFKPLVPGDGYLFGHEPGTQTINNGIPGLPPSSPTLQNLIGFCGEYYPIPPFEKRRRKALLALKKILGRPVHVSRLRRGVWAPVP